MPDDLMLQIAQTLAQVDRRLARLEAAEFKATMSASSILTALKTVDGTASLLDADLLDGLEGAAYAGTATVTAGTILAKLLTVDGTASLLDADLLDGQHASAFMGTTSLDGYLTANGATPLTNDWDSGAYRITTEQIKAQALIIKDADGLEIRDNATNRVVASIADSTGNVIIGTVSKPSTVAIYGVLTTSGSANIGGAANVSGSASFGSASFSSTPVVAGTAVSLVGHTHEGYLGAGFLKDDGSTPLTGAWNAGTQAVTLGSTLNVSGVTTLGTSLNVNPTGGGSVSFGTVTGNTPLFLYGDLSTYGPANLWSTLDVTGHAALKGAATITGTANIAGTASVGALNVGGSALIMPAAGTVALRSAANTFTANQRVPRLEIDNANNYIDADTSGIIQLKATSIVIADSAFLTIGNIHAVLFIIDVSSGAFCIMYCRGAYNATQELLDVSGRFSVTKDTATSINVYWDAGGNYVLQNKIGATRTLTLYEMLG